MSELKRLYEIVGDFRYAMLTTQTREGQLHARPMTIAMLDRDARTLCFLTSVETSIPDEIAVHDRVIVTLQNSDVFVQWSGRARVENNRELLNEIWQAAFALWWPDGPSDSRIRIVRVEADVAEYWDQRGISKYRTLFERAVGAARGRSVEDDSPSPDSSQHARISLDHGASR